MWVLVRRRLDGPCKRPGVTDPPLSTPVITGGCKMLTGPCCHMFVYQTPTVVESTGLLLSNLYSVLTRDETVTVWKHALHLQKCSCWGLFPTDGKESISDCNLPSSPLIQMQKHAYTDRRRLTTGIRSEKCVVRRFRCCVNGYFHKPR
jgi:hypothetical protein